MYDPNTEFRFNSYIPQMVRHACDTRDDDALLVWLNITIEAWEAALVDRKRLALVVLDGDRRPLLDHGRRGDGLDRKPDHVAGRDRCDVGLLVDVHNDAGLVGSLDRSDRLDAHGSIGRKALARCFGEADSVSQKTEARDGS